jgi:hypothetical protein
MTTNSDSHSKKTGWATTQDVVTYRLIVVARRPPDPKGFGWDIIREGQGGSESVAERSTVSYRSMHEAYLHGAAALGWFPRSM